MTEINDAGPGSVGPRLQPCPSCGLLDRVSGVPAVYLAGKEKVTEVVPAAGDDPERRVTRRITSALSAALAPAPPAQSSPLGALGVLAVVVSIAAFIWGAAAGHWFSPDRTEQSYGSWTVPPDAARPDFAFLGWISAIALLTAVLLFVEARGRRTRFRQRMTGRPAAERLWSQGWYCERCGTVHFATDPGEPPRALTLQEFRATVWQTGGYGDLAPDHPVV